jgi:HK97 family phage major capsid protein
MNDELKNALESLKAEIKGKTNEEVKSAIDSFEEKYKENVANEVKSVKDELDKEIKALQDQADKLQIKFQESVQAKEVKKVNHVRKAIKDNFDSISSVSSSSPYKYTEKTMTLGTAFTGTQPTDYNFDLVLTPAQAVNVEDLIRTITVADGSYTFFREGATVGNVADQVEGGVKAELEFPSSSVTVSTEFKAGFARYSKKMANNLPYLESNLPFQLRRQYYFTENTDFNDDLAAGVTASALTSGGNKIERLINEVAQLENDNFMPNGIVVSTADFYDMIQIEKSTGSGYGFPPGVTFEGGQLRILGIPVFKVNWITEANHYYVGDWSRVSKVVTQGLGLEFFEQDSDNVQRNLITARIEAQVAIAIEQPAAIRYGDFTAS